jgi:hypothetical protein
MGLLEADEENDVSLTNLALLAKTKALVASSAPLGCV